MAGSIDRYASLLRKVAGGLLWPLSVLIAPLPAGAEEPIPLPRERPAVDTQDRLSTPSIDLAPTPCQLRLAELAAFKPKPPILGPGECSAIRCCRT